MAINLSQLEARQLTQQEVEGSKRAWKQLGVDWLKARLIDVSTNEPICVGQGVEIGPFASVNEGRNFVSYYLTEATKQLGWGQTRTKDGRRVPPTAHEIHTREGQVYVWIIRIKE